MTLTKAIQVGAALFVLAMTGCASPPPPPIPLGAEVAPLMGCIELRERNGDC